MKPRFLLTLALLAYVALIAATYGGYGITWDSPENFDMGERFARFAVTRDAAVLDTRVAIERPPGIEMPPFSSAWSRQVPQAMWPITNTLSGFTYLLFGEGLGWLNPVDAHHVVLLPLLLLLALSVNRLVASRCGEGWGLVAVLLLLTWPRLFGHAHNNIKDVPLTAFYAAAVFTGVRAVTRGRWWWWLLAVLAFGCALGTRPNGLFALATVGVWMLLRRPMSGNPAKLRAAVGLALVGILGAAFVIGAWPLLHVTPPSGFPVPGVERPLDYLGLALEYISTINARAELGWNLYAFGMLAAVTPVAMVALVLLGTGVAVRSVWTNNDDADLALLSLIWLTITLGRTITPWSAIYDGVRHVLEALPAMVILAVIGARHLATRTAPRWRMVAIVLIGVAVVEGAIGIATTHPYQTTYFNAAVGGLGGAQRRDLPFACDYWASSYRDAAKWLNEHAPPRASVNIPVAGHLAPWLGLRDDLIVSSVPGGLPTSAASPKHYVLIHPRRTSTQSLRPQEVPFHRFHPRVLALLTRSRRVERGGGVIYEIYEAGSRELTALSRSFPGVVRPADGPVDGGAR